MGISIPCPTERPRAGGDSLRATKPLERYESLLKIKFYSLKSFFNDTDESPYSRLEADQRFVLKKKPAKRGGLLLQSGMTSSEIILESELHKIGTERVIQPPA